MALKIKLKRIAGVPTTSNLETGEVAINTSNNQIYANLSGTIVAISGGEVDLSAVDQDIVPDANNTRSLGTASKRFSDLFLSGDTINLGGATISSDGTGTVAVSATGVTLPSGSKAGDNKIAVNVTGSGGVEQAATVVPFFSRSGGLSTTNTNFNFNATVDDKFVYTGAKTFTLANGTTLADSNITLFQF